MPKFLRFTDKPQYKDNAQLCQGKVKIYKNNKLLIEKNNHIVVIGRNWLMQRMFNLPYSLDNQKHTWLPRWFSVGNGGAANDAPFQPIWPTDNDIDVYNNIVFVDSAHSTSRYTINRTKKLIDGVSFASALTAKLTMTISYEDCVNEYINEAGLFVSPTESSTETNFTMFSHVTFPTIPKSNLTELVIEWFFIF